MNMFWLLRMKRWVQNPPSKARVYLIFSIIAFCVVLYLIERYLGWPDFLTVNKQPRGLGFR